MAETDQAMQGWLFVAHPQVGFAIKQVVGKIEPQSLEADDGSVCRTSRDRFERTRTGKWIACSWSYPFLDSTAVAQN
jgi:hypothetical protein